MNVSGCCSTNGGLWLWGSNVNYQLAKGEVEDDAQVPEKLRRTKTFGFRSVYSLSFGGQHAALLAGQPVETAPPPAAAAATAEPPPAAAEPIPQPAPAPDAPSAPAAPAVTAEPAAEPAPLTAPVPEAPSSEEEAVPAIAEPEAPAPNAE